MATERRGGPAPRAIAHPEIDLVMHSKAVDAASECARLLRALVVLACLLAAPAAFAQKTFGTPEQAVQGLLAATRAMDAQAVLTVLGSGARKLVQSGDAVADRNSLS